jgi:hypothetical protein
MSLQANLSDFNLSEIIYLLVHFKKTGVITVKAGKNYGEIYLDQGRAVHAALGDVKGSEAVYGLCLESSGEAKFTPGARSSEETIKEGADALIQEGDRRRMEMAEVLKSLPPFNTVLVRTAQAPDETGVTIRRSDWTILALINGKKDIRTIIEDSKLGVLEVAKTLAWFLSKNLVADPLEVERVLEEKVGLINLMLEEFGVKGTGVAPWMELAKSVLAEADKGGHLLRHLEFSGFSVRIKEGSKTDLVKEDVIAAGNQVAEALHQKGIKEYGPMLAKHKYQAVQKLAQGA